jgi:hypothetical protein
VAGTRAAAAPEAAGSRRQTVGWLFAGLAVHLLFLGSLRWGWLNRLFNDSSHTSQAFDFQIYYLAGKAVLAGRDVYGLDAGFGFRYLPAFAHVVARVLALSSPPVAYLAYLLLTEALLAADLYLLWRWLAPWPQRRAGALFMWLAATPVYLEMYMGQVSLWASSLLLVFLWTVDTGRQRLGVAAWTSAILVKPNALLLAPALLRRGRWRGLAAAFGLVAATSLPHFLLHPGSWPAFCRANLGPSQVQGALTHAGNLGLAGTWISLAAKASERPLAQLGTLADLPLWGQALVAGAGAAVLVVTAWSTWRDRDPDPLVVYTLWLTTYFLLYKDVWEHHYVFLLPVLSVLYARTSARWLWLAFAAVALPTPFALLDVQPGQHGAIDPERTWSLATSLLYRVPKLAAVVVLWAWQIRRLGQPRPATKGAPGRPGAVGEPATALI